ncbi:MAG: hypothetical protein BAJATHORv1_10192 [Candidatus Thorarchaeota archaeon]|nr:MAG: hypothetical protein BAJATHORv1_10192 [Candidatus Thorarchaeota archaeon]
MELKKHKDDLAIRLEILDDIADGSLASEIIELYETKCSECQEDRLACTVRPSCKNRNFLNALIEIGVEPQDLPSFCYSQYLDQVKRYILERKGRSLYDRRVPIKDLLSTLRVSSIKHFLTRFKKIWTKMSVLRVFNVKVVVGDDLLFHFDLSRGVVVVNPRNLIISTLNMFKIYVEVFSEHYNVKYALNDLTTNWWILKLGSDKLPPKKLKEIASKFENQFEEIHILDDGEFQLEVELVTDSKGARIKVGELNRLFTMVSGSE